MVASFNNLVDGDKNQVSEELKSRGYNKEILKLTNLILEQNFRPVISCGIKFTKPFHNLVFEPLHYVLHLYDIFERGVMPYPGAASEQPAQIIEIFSVIKNLKLEQDIKRQKKLNDGRH